MKALIIDDEKKARVLLTTILTDFCPEITEVFEAEDLLSGIESIRANKPQVVFLDIEMPEHKGTKLFEFMDASEIDFHIIFTTAYSDFAIQAFEMNAIDYLLKPMRPNKVKEAVEKLKQKIKNNFLSQQITELKANFKSATFKKIGLPMADGILFVELDDLIVMEADGMYTKVYSQNNSSHVVSKPLKYFVDILEKNDMFYRPHRSFLINLQHIKQFVRKDGSYIVMNNDVIVSISRDKKSEFVAMIEGV